MNKTNVQKRQAAGVRRAVEGNQITLVVNIGDDLEEIKALLHDVMQNATRLLKTEDPELKKQAKVVHQQLKAAAPKIQAADQAAERIIQHIHTGVSKVLR